MFLPESNVFLCSTCENGSLIFRDYCMRILNHESGISEWLHIPRHQCNSKQCQKIHRMLADFMVPFKHYSEEVISGILGGVVLPSDEDSADYPSEQTMIRWLKGCRYNQGTI